MDVYLVIGNPNTRKSSLIRSLSGCFNRNLRDIQLLDGRTPIRLYARAGSAQDSRKTPDELIAEAQGMRCAAVLCGLLPSEHPNEPQLYPGARRYVEAFKAAGWAIRAIAVLGQNAGELRGTNLRQFPLAPTAPINATAREVRTFFGWA